jgi:hypothetical protein
MEDKMYEIKNRNIAMVYILMIVTLGIYAIVWMVKTKGEINSLGGDIPTSWFLIIPIANIWWVYKYCECFSNNVKKDNNPIMWFLLYLIFSPIMPAIVQSELNKVSNA